MESPTVGAVYDRAFCLHKVILFLFLSFLLESTANATWSIVAVDKNTGRVVIASATCLAWEEPESLKGIQAVIVPGKGVAACQALVDYTGKNQMLVFEQLQKGTDPKEIVRMLEADPAIDQRQFGIVDLQGRSAGFSGRRNGRVSMDAQGEVPGTGIFYSIQGNILRPDDVIPNAVKAFVNAKGAITDRVMAAMEAADAHGGDSRCSCDSTPKAAAPCDGKTSHVAYILMADPRDTNGISFNDGKYALYITVTQGTIRPNENANPVKTLRMRYDSWRKAQPASFR